MNEPQFPIILYWNERRALEKKGIDCPRSVPWRLLAPHEAQAIRNHAQDLKKLASRGGLSPGEMMAIIEGKGIRQIRPDEEEAPRLMAWLESQSPTWRTHGKPDIIGAWIEHSKLTDHELVLSFLNAVRIDTEQPLATEIERRNIISFDFSNAEVRERLLESIFVVTGMTADSMRNAKTTKDLIDILDWIIKLAAHCAKKLRIISPEAIIGFTSYEIDAEYERRAEIERQKVRAAISVMSPEAQMVFDDVMQKVGK